MILRDKEIVFVHIPKNGGTSIEDALFPPVVDRNLGEHLWGRPNPHQTGGMQHLQAIKIKELVGRDLYDRCFKFSIVRNPWDRAISMYMYHHKRYDLQKFLGIQDRSLFRRLLGRQKMVPFVNYLRAVKAGPIHVQWDDQYKFICDTSGTVIVDFVGRFETLQKDFEIVCNKLGISAVTLPHRKKSERREYSHYYDDESKHLVSDMYERDIDMFGYTFEDN